MQRLLVLISLKAKGDLLVFVQKLVIQKLRFKVKMRLSQLYLVSFLNQHDVFMECKYIIHCVFYRKQSI